MRKYCTFALRRGGRQAGKSTADRSGRCLGDVEAANQHVDQVAAIG